MSDWFRDRYPPARPREVEDGLKARTARGAIGASWWSRRFLAVLESFAMGSRLTRGRNYARRGQVISLDVQPGEVRARVQGSRVRPYDVRIGLAAFSELVWAKAEIALSEQALPSAKLLAGEVPPELEELFAAAGAPLFPRTAGELDQRCSCPDGMVPCKHLAATFYLLAEAFDDDPFLILRWRGRDREALLGRLRELRADGAVRGAGRTCRAVRRRDRARAERAGLAGAGDGPLLAAGRPAPAAAAGAERRAGPAAPPAAAARRRAGRPGAGRPAPGCVRALRGERFIARRPQLMGARLGWQRGHLPGERTGSLRSEWYSAPAPNKGKNDGTKGYGDRHDSDCS